MNILGIETSCDETAASVVKDGKIILSNVIASSLKEHSKYGGIIPEIASRRQIELIQLIVQEALERAGISLNRINAIAVTEKPGLIGSLLVGISFARALSFATNKPLLSIDHIQAHLYANFLSEKIKVQRIPKLPALGLVVSGGHSSVFYFKNFQNIKLLGQTRDDAAGEAFDKVARLLKLGYPGGPIIDRLAKSGINDEIHFPCADLPGSDDFSFSGIKTAVLYHVQKHADPVNKIAYAFQKSVVSTIVQKCLSICRRRGLKTILVGGGVAANSALREKLSTDAKKEAIEVFFPPLRLCLDNAAMIAGLAFHLISGKKHAE